MLRRSQQLLQKRRQSEFLARFFVTVKPFTISIARFDPLYRHLGTTRFQPHHIAYLNTRIAHNLFLLSYRIALLADQGRQKIAKVGLLQGTSQGGRQGRVTCSDRRALAD